MKLFKNFARREEGGMTILGLYIFMMMMLIGGLALDVSNAIQARTQLQVAADAAGHAALFSRVREFKTPSEAKTKAIEIAALNMPSGYYGNVLAESDIVFGDWDSATQTFTPDATSLNAVWVSTRRIEENSNALATYLLKIIGLTSLDINTDTVWEMYTPGCMMEGFVAEGEILFEGLNDFRSGFCIHSNTRVDMQNANEYEADSVVSIPDPLSDVTGPGTLADIIAANPGLGDALRPGAYELNIPERIDEIYAGMLTPGSEYYQSWLTDPTLVDLPRGAGFEAGLIAGGAYYIGCNAPAQQLTFTANFTLQNVILITNCRIQLGEDMRIIDSILYTSNTRNDSIAGAAGVEVGDNDSCAAGGGSYMISEGGMQFAAAFQNYGSQIIAEQDINFAASGIGGEGASFFAGGQITATTQMDMGFCGGGLPTFIDDFFRMVL